MRVSIVSYQKVQEHKDFRFDADYYKPIYLEIEKTLKDKKTARLADCVKEVRTGPFGSTMLSDTYAEDGVIVYRPFNIKNHTLESENLVYVSKQDVEEKGLRYYSAGDLFFSRVGDVRCGVVPDTGRKLTISPNIIAARTDTKRLNPYYAAIFFNTKYGFLQIERGLKVVAQPTIQSDLVRNLQIVLLSNQFQLRIEKLFKHYFKLEKLSRTSYEKANKHLLSELGLANWQPKHRLTFVKNSKEVLSAERLDAEYFQPKYDDLIQAIKETGQDVRLGNCLKQSLQRGMQPEYTDNREIPVINSKHVGKTHITLDNNRFTSKAFVQSKKKRGLVKQYDVLLNSTGYITIGRCQVMLDDIPAFADGHVAIIRPELELDPVYLAFFLNAITGQLQTEQGWTGSSGQIELRQDVVANYTIWKAPAETQKKIHQYVEDAHKARQRSQELLEAAKRAVEMAIEEGEEKALAWLEAETRLVQS